VAAVRTTNDQKSKSSRQLGDIASNFVMLLLLVVLIVVVVVARDDRWWWWFWSDHDPSWLAIDRSSKVRQRPTTAFLIRRRMGNCIH
jgi:hypothetical protein